MKTREAIQLEYENQRVAISNQYYAQVEAARAARDAALAELNDPVARLIAAAKRAGKSHNGGMCRCVRCNELRDAINYAEQRRAQG